MYLDINKQSEPKTAAEVTDELRYFYLPYAVIDAEEFEAHKSLRTAIGASIFERYLNGDSNKEILLYLYAELCWTSDFTLAFTDYFVDYYSVSCYLGKFILIVLRTLNHEVLSITGFKKGE